MKNITLAIDEELLAKARALAIKQHTSLNAIVRSLLSHEVEQEDRTGRAKAGLKRLMDNSTGDMGVGYVWNRDEIYAERENRILSRLEHPDLRGDRKKE
jgi:hypothetical protein